MAISKKMDTVRVQVTLSKDMVNRVDNVAEMYGVNRSAFLAMIIGQSISATESSMKFLNDQLADRLASGLTQK